MERPPRDSTRTRASNFYEDIKLKAHLIKWLLFVVFLLFIFDFVPDYGSCQYNQYFPDGIDGIVSYLNPFDNHAGDITNINYNASFSAVLEQNCVEHNLTYQDGFCVFPDGRECEAQAYYRGRCSMNSNCSLEKYSNINYFIGLLFGKNDEINQLIEKPDKIQWDWIKIALGSVGQLVVYIIVISFIFVFLGNWKPYTGVGILWTASAVVGIPVTYYIIGLDAVVNLIMSLLF